MAGSASEKVLGAEWLAIMMIETADALDQSSGGFTLPSPARYFATMIVFLSLAAVAMFGEKPGKIAASFGAVVAIAMALAPSKKGGKPVIMGFLDYLVKFTGGVSPTAPNQLTAATTTGATVLPNTGTTSPQGTLV